MPEDDIQALERARKDAREGKAPTTQAGEFIREEMHHIREGKHGARSPQQAIAIGLSKARARRQIAAARQRQDDRKDAQSAQRAYEQGQREGLHHHPSPKRSRAISRALKREGRQAASPAALARHAHQAAAQHTARERSAAARKAARTKGPAGRSAAARQATRTRAQAA